MSPLALGKSSRSGFCSCPKPFGGTPACLETGTRARLERGRDGGSGTERGRGRCGSGAAVFGAAKARSRLSAATGLFASAQPSLRQNVFGVSRRPSAHAFSQYRPPREAAPPPAALRPARANAHSSRALSLFPRKSGMSPLFRAWLQLPVEEAHDVGVCVQPRDILPDQP